MAVYWEFYRRRRTVVVALQQAAIVDESFARRSQELMEPDLRHLAGHLAGLDLPGDPLVVASMVTTLLSTFADLWLSGRGPDLGRELSDEEAIETLTSFLYAGIGGPVTARPTASAASGSAGSSSPSAPAGRRTGT